MAQTNYERGGGGAVAAAAVAGDVRHRLSLFASPVLKTCWSSYDKVIRQMTKMTKIVRG